MAVATQLYSPNCVLAEGCIWHEQEQALYFVDIEGCQVHSYCIPSQTAQRIFVSQRVGCLTLHSKQGLIRAETNQLIYNPQGLLPQTQERRLLTQRFPSYLRYNDGKCDRYGNLWVGTMAISQSHPKAVGGGSLYCINEGQVVAAYGGYTIPNGLDWSLDGSVCYHIDTYQCAIFSYQVEAEYGLTHKQVVLTVPEQDGKPDGMCMDCQGNLWVAMWGGGKVIGYHLPTGEKLEEIVVPDRYVTCCCFGGADGKELFITTARDEQGKGGQIYHCHLPVGGKEVYSYGR